MYGSYGRAYGASDPVTQQIVAMGKKASGDDFSEEDIVWSPSPKKKGIFAQIGGLFKGKKGAGGIQQQEIDLPPLNQPTTVSPVQPEPVNTTKIIAFGVLATVALGGAAYAAKRYLG